MIAEDDPVSKRLLEATLEKWGNEVLSFDNGEDAWDQLQSPDPPRLVILDWMMPRLDGIEICKRIRKQFLEEYIYIILLTAKGKKGDMVDGLEAGADDYITKPFNMQELKVRLRAGRRILELQEALIAAREQMRDRATHDPLTGLLNRAAASDTLNSELQRAIREDSPMSVVMGDIDHFKQINDSFGHLAGDSVLREVARRMSTSIRPYDTVSRYGGEEFLLIIPGCSRKQAKSLAERIRERIREKPFDTPEGMIPVTISFGVADTTMDSCTYPEALLRAADAALYRAKEKGRDRVEVATRYDLPGSSEGLSCAPA